MIIITENLLEFLRKKGAALTELPFLLLGKKYPDSIIIDKALPLINISKHPKTEFIPDPSDFLKTLHQTTLLNPKSDDDFIGIFHNHPKGPATPSKTDIKGCRWDGYYLIYSKNYNNFNLYKVNNKTWELQNYAKF